MKHADFFNGIGGFQLAAQWAGWENVMSCEIDDFCNKVTGYYWPQCKQYGDIKTTDFSVWRGRIDILSGGFPCQPYSTAGKRKRKEDERHLWPEMLRGIREIQPRWVVGENVRGLISWNGGLVFDEVQSDLEAEGYEVLPFLLPAAGVDAPHRRDRIWFVAYSGGDGHRRNNKSGEARRKEVESEVEQKEWERIWCDTGGIGIQTDASDTNGKPRWWELQHACSEISVSWEESTRRDATCAWDRWQNFPTQSPVCNGDDGISTRLDFASVFGSIKHPRQPARAFGRWRNNSIKSGGNAIVPHVAFQIFSAINQYEKLYS